MKKLIKRVNDWLARRAFEKAQDVAFLNRRGLRPSLFLGYLGVGLVLLTPLAVAASGAYLIVTIYPSISGILVGIVLMLIGWGLLPRRARVPSEACSRDDLPALFELTDQVGATMGAPKVDRIVLDHDFNAYVFLSRPFLGLGRRKVVLGIGLTLWGTLAPDQKVALLAHELGHLVNRDPGRTSFLGYGLETVQRWAFWTRPSTSINPYAGTSLAEEIVNFFLAVLGVFLEFIYLVIRWTMMHHSQIAEYAADAKSAEVAGPAAARSALTHLLLAPEAERSLRGLRMFDKPKDGWIIDHMINEIRATPEDRRERYFDQAMKEQSSVDDSHPPTSYRLAFLEHLPLTPPKLVLDPQRELAIDADIEPYKHTLGAELVTVLGMHE